MKLLRARRCLMVAIAGSVSAACASSEIDRYFEEEQYVQTTLVFETDSSLATDEDALFQAGVSYALPDSPVHDAERALELLERLLALYPDTKHRQEATWILTFLDHEIAFTDQLAEVSDSLTDLRASDPRRTPDGASAGARELHRLVEQARYSEAVESFEADSTLQSEESALFDAAVAYSDPSSEVREPWEARVLLERLADLYPDTRYRPAANRLMDLLNLEIRLRLRIHGLNEELEELKAIDLGSVPEPASP
jgi:tetratricopeptide (TPR) repeat protein